jgi:cephalosporin-C deacetylase-like acetyl esterase/lysophospholipase L1-like esterase
MFYKGDLMARSRFVHLLGLAFLLVTASNALAQQLTFTPYHANGIYDVNEKVGWTVALPQGAATPATPYTYTIKKNNFGAPIKTGTLDLSNGSASIEITISEPCMLYVQIATPTGPAEATRAGPGRGGMALGAAVAPTRIEPSQPRSADFDSFWDAKIKALNAIPARAELTPSDSGRPGIEFYTFKLDSLGSKVQGFLAKPAKEGKFPAVVIFQWAGVYALPKNTVLDFAAKGWLAINVDSHDKEPNAPNGPPQNYQAVGNTDRETCYFLNMYLRDYRAIDYIASRPEWDGKTLVVTGTSMGGQQSLCAAGLNPKVTHLIVNVPAGCDFCGALHGRASGYPNWPSNNPDILKTAPYFDAVNFASHIKATSLVAMGFIDTVAPPVGIWAAFNQIKGPKEAAPMFDSAHNNQATAQQQRPFTSRSAEWFNTLVKGEPLKPNESTVRPSTSAAMGADQPVARTDQNSQTGHAQLLEKAKKGGIDVYFEGDSITRRWGALDYPDFLANWKQNFFGWNAADFGWGGDTTGNILWRLNNGELDNVNPKVIVVMTGTNNISRLPSRGDDDPRIADVTKGIKAVLDMCRKKSPQASIILMGITPRNDVADNPTGVMPVINGVNANIARFTDGKKIRYLNINDKLADKDGKLYDGMAVDKLHLTLKGYQIWADALKPILTELLGPPAKEDHAPPPTGDPSALTRPAVTGGKTFDVRGMGAAGDGRTKDTAVFQQAIDQCSAAGGGEVVIPAGDYVIGAIALKTNTTLRLQQGATLIGSPDINDYPLATIRWEGRWEQGHRALIYANDANNITIIGPGRINGAKPLGFRRNPRAPALIEPIHCTGVRLEGFSASYASMWTIHPTRCADVVATGLTIRSTGGNSDGIDLDSCKNVRVERCDIDSGDDSIAIKSGRGMEGFRAAEPSENIVITDCTLGDTNFACIGIGSEMSGGIRNVRIEHCTFTHSKSCSIYIKSRPGRGGVIENIAVSDANVVSSDGAFLRLNMLSSGKQDSEPVQGDDGIPQCRNLSFSGVRLANCGGIVAATEIPPTKLVEGFALSNVSGTAKAGMALAHFKGVRLSDIKVTGINGPMLKTQDVTGTGIEGAVPLN